MTARPTAAIGFRAHSGWAVAVIVAGTVAKPAVIERRRIQTADGTRQPFHAAEGLGFAEAEALIRKCRERSVELAAGAVDDLMRWLAEAGYAVTGAGILTASGRALPDLEKILQSHALIHAAEGEFFRDVLADACAARLVRVSKFREREVAERGDLTERVREMGLGLGPPWRQDEKLAAMAAWLVMVEASR